MKRTYLLVLCSVSAFSLLACTGLRNSYESLLAPDSESSLIVIKVGESR